MKQRSFAYGSNLNLHDWHRWCGANGFREGLLRPLFTALLPDRSRGFTRWSSTRRSGVLDVQPARGHPVEGVVFAVEDNGWDALDRKEGAPKAYRALDLEALTVDGLAHRVRTFEVVPGRRERFVEPDAHYLGIVRDGYRAFGISATALDAAAVDGSAPSSLASLFAYGTLMRGESRAAVLADLPGSLVAAGRVPGQLVDLGNFPGLRPDASRKAWVVGEVHRPVDGLVLEALDRIEGFPGFELPGGLFRRRIVDLGSAADRMERAWTYVLVTDRAFPNVQSGDWRAHRRTLATGCVGPEQSGY
jgi:gamma-glutamylcyclotransferase (GGCT)/AIG2-like uncharacterized protein YtfP